MKCSIARELFKSDDPPVYALTLWDPWASAIVFGPKRVENRPWPPISAVMGRNIWIHVGATYDGERASKVRDLWPELDQRPRFTTPAIIGSARVVGYGYRPEIGEDDFLDHCEDMERRQELHGEATAAIFDDAWWIGPYGWLLADVRPLSRPVLCRGYQKLWRPSLAAQRELERVA